jgi:Flp pilus assembly protein TadG
MRVKRLKTFSKDCRGAATIEMALVATSMIVFAPLIMDLATVITSSVALGGGLRTGMQFALGQPANTAGITQAVQTASGLGNGVAVTSSETCDCSGTAVVCSSTCPLGGSPAAYVAITAKYSVPTLLPYSGYPQNSFPINKAVTVRVH